MNRSETIANLAMSLSKFQGEMTNPKNTAKNPQFNSKYAPLQDILALARPLLSKQGLSLIQSTTGDLENVTISTMLIHESGEFLETDPFILKGEQTARGGGKVVNVQGAGSMITYIRRYQVSAMLGVASEDDDDGAHSVGYKPVEQIRDKPKLVEKEETPANIEGFFVEAMKIGFTKTMVLKEVGEISIDKWSQAKLGSLYRDLKAKSLSEKVGN